MHIENQVCVNKPAVNDIKVTLNDNDKGNNADTELTLKLSHENLQKNNDNNSIFPVQEFDKFDDNKYIAELEAAFVDELK